MLGPLDAPDSELMNAFLGTLRPGPADPPEWRRPPARRLSKLRCCPLGKLIRNRQHEYMLLANLQAILHELM